MADKGELGWRVLAGAAAFAGGFVAKKTATLVWQKTTGKEPPTNPESPDVALAEAIGWAVLTGVSAELARLLATRAVAHQWTKGTGEVPAHFRAES